VEIVRSTNSDILTGPGDRPGADMTARLLLALTTLYVQRPTHTAEEQQQYVELALRLIDKVEAATRAAVGGILPKFSSVSVAFNHRAMANRSASLIPRCINTLLAIDTRRIGNAHRRRRHPT